MAVIFEFEGSFGRAVPEWGWGKFVGEISTDVLAELNGPIGPTETPNEVFKKHQAWITQIAGEKVGSMTAAPVGPIVLTMTDFSV